MGLYYAMLCYIGTVLYHSRGSSLSFGPSPEAVARRGCHGPLCPGAEAAASPGGGSEGQRKAMKCKGVHKICIYIYMYFIHYTYLYIGKYICICTYICMYMS